MALLVAALLIAGCGGDDDEGGEPGGTSAPAPDAAVFESDEVGFTFQYPEGFAAETKPDGQVLGQVSVEPEADLNAIKIRKTADQELGPERYLDEFQRDFARTVGQVDKREDTVGDLELGVLEFEDSVDQRGKPVEFTSTSYFFSGGGKTWQVECIADSEHSAEIDAACRGALETVDFKA